HAQSLQAIGNQVDAGLVIGIHVVARRADQAAAERRIEFRYWRIERVQMNVRHARIEQAAEALDEADHFDFSLTGASDSTVNGCIQGRRIAAGRQDSNALHAAASNVAVRKSFTGSVCGTRSNDAARRSKGAWIYPVDVTISGSPKILAKDDVQSVAA